MYQAIHCLSFWTSWPRVPPPAPRLALAACGSHGCCGRGCSEATGQTSCQRGIPRLIRSLRGQSLQELAVGTAITGGDFEGIMQVASQDHTDTCVVARRCRKNEVVECDGGRGQVGPPKEARGSPGGVLQILSQRRSLRGKMERGGDLGEDREDDGTHNEVSPIDKLEMVLRNSKIREHWKGER